MKICILCDFYYDNRLPGDNMKGGAEVCSKFMAEGLAKKNIELHVVTPNLYKDEYEKQENGKLIIHRYESKLRRKILSKGSKRSKAVYSKNRSIFSFIHGLYKSYSARELAKSFNKINEKEKFDIVHANNVEPAMALEFISGIKKTAHIRDFNTLKKKIYADRFIAINERHKELAEEKGFKNISVIHDPLFKDKLSPLDKKEAREKCLEPENLKKNIILFVGSLIKERNPKFVEKLAKRFENKLFIIIGDGPIRVEQMPNIIHLRSVGQKIIKSYYKAADIMVYPCLTDWGFGLNVIEAMANGTPVISFPIKGIDEVIKDGKNGFIVPEDKFEKKILELFQEMGKILYASKNAKDITDRFDEEKILHQLKEFFNFSYNS